MLGVWPGVLELAHLSPPRGAARRALHPLKAVLEAGGGTSWPGWQGGYIGYSLSGVGYRLYPTLYRPGLASAIYRQSWKAVVQACMR